MSDELTRYEREVKSDREALEEAYRLLDSLNIPRDGDLSHRIRALSNISEGWLRACQSVDRFLCALAADGSIELKASHVETIAAMHDTSAKQKDRIAVYEKTLAGQMRQILEEQARRLDAQIRIPRDELYGLIDQHVSATDEWGGSKLAGWRWGYGVCVSGIDDATDAIVSRLTENPATVPASIEPSHAETIASVRAERDQKLKAAQATLEYIIEADGDRFMRHTFKEICKRARNTLAYLKSEAVKP